MVLKSIRMYLYPVPERLIRGPVNNWQPGLILMLPGGTKAETGKKEGIHVI